MYKKINFYIFCFFISFLLMECKSLLNKKIDSIKNCKFDVTSVKLSNPKIVGIPPIPKVDFILGVKVENPSDEEVTIHEMDLVVYLDGSDGKELKFARLQTNEEYKIEKKSTKEITILLKTSFEKGENNSFTKIAILVLAGHAAGKKQMVLIKGNVKYKTPLGTFSIPIKGDSSGKIELGS